MIFCLDRIFFSQRPIFKSLKVAENSINFKKCNSFFSDENPQVQQNILYRAIFIII